MEIYQELLADRPKIAFVHIPKTGGRTFRRILHNQAPDCRSIEINNPQTGAQFSAWKEQDKACLDLIEGHLAFDYIPALPRRFQYFTLMRDPVDRAISQYNHLMKLETNIPIAPKMRQENWSLMQFITNNDPETMAYVNAQTAFLGGIQRYVNTEKSLVIDWNDLFERAVINMLTNFQFVGILERLDEGLIYLKERYGFVIQYEKIGETPLAAKTPVGENERELMRPYLKPDMELYGLARMVFESRLKIVDNLAEKVLSFREENASGK